jgi:hypothetical protein
MGRYIAKIDTDADPRLIQDWKTQLGNKDFVGQIEYQPQWWEGYGGLTAIAALRFSEDDSSDDKSWSRFFCHNPR